MTSRNWRNRTLLLFLTASTAFLSVRSFATVLISTAATKNMSCNGGVCTPTAKSAVLNVTDLETMLASSSVSVNTADAVASDIKVNAAVTWTSANGLTLDAYRSITVEQPIADEGTASITLLSNDGGTGGALSFGSKGSISFLGTSNVLTINGNVYTLANSVSSLASDIAANSSGFYALSASYDASHDGTYGQSPIATRFEGALEGLGNAISNLSISSAPVPDAEVGLFSEIDTPASVSNLRVLNVNITANGNINLVGGLAGTSDGTVYGDSVSGVISGARHAQIGGLIGNGGGSIVSCSSTAKVRARNVASFGGGLVGVFGGTILNSYATGDVAAGTGAKAGGLVGENLGIIDGSFAAGNVKGGKNAWVGGLIGFTVFDTGQALVVNSYATGPVAGGSGSNAGGLVGYDDFRNGGAINNSYSTGTVSGGTVGGSIGFDNGCGCLSDLYWDTTTSGITNLSQGAGNIPNDPGITGETTAQLQAGLPAGFDPKVWAENPNINGGLPYLIANPPPK